MIVRGLESAAKGMVALMDMNDRIANNLANVNTVGFKKGELRFKDVMQSAVYSQEGSILRNDTSRYLGTVSMGSEAYQYECMCSYRYLYKWFSSGGVPYS
jgi:flagellar basal-body rod protein FlgG